MKDLLFILINAKFIFTFVVTFTLYFGLALDAYLNNKENSLNLTNHSHDSIFGYAPIIRVMTWYGFWVQVFLISFGPYVSFSCFVVFISLFMTILALLKDGISYIYNTFEILMNRSDLLAISIFAGVAALITLNVGCLIHIFASTKYIRHLVAILCGVVLSINLISTPKYN